MPEVAVYNMEGQEVGTANLNEKIFGVEPNHDLMHRYVVMYLANQRQGTAATKTRAAVRGGGRKPWRQKGTGRARQGSIRVPQWVGGGVVFGPQPRDHRQKMPKKARRNALRSALSAKAQGERVIVLDKLTFPEPKTKAMLTVLGNLNIADGKALVVTGEPDRTVVLSARNLPKVEARMALDLNAYDVLNYDYVVFTQGALDKIEEVLG